MQLLQLEPLLPMDKPISAIVAEALREAPNREVEDHVQAVAEGQMSLYCRTAAAVPWIGYLARNEETREVIGSCSFIGNPSACSVEIAYFTFPPYEGIGVATAMARELLKIAVSAGDPDLHAFTLREENASTRILQKLGFTRVGEAKDDDVGLVWRWERASKSHSQ